jgi:hypothetical protein
MLVFVAHKKRPESVANKGVRRLFHGALRILADHAFY